MLETASQFARRANIERYRKILGTHLIAEERRFVERRLAEEQALLQKLRGSVDASTTTNTSVTSPPPVPRPALPSIWSESRIS
jgi:hypothetical protein